MKEILLWIFVYIPLGWAIISTVVPLILFFVAMLFYWVGGFFKKSDVSTKQQAYLNQVYEKSKLPNYNERRLSTVGIVLVSFFAVIFALFILSLVATPEKQTVSSKLPQMVQLDNENKKSQNKLQIKNTQYNTKFYIDIANITSEFELKRSMKNIYEKCVAANLAQGDSDDIDVHLFCECFTSTMFYNLNSYGVAYILDYMGGLTQEEVDNIKKINKGTKGLMLKSLAKTYAQHLESAQVLEVQKDIAAFSCVRELTDKENLPSWLDTDSIANALDYVSPHDTALNMETNDDLQKDRNVDKIIYRNMVFSYNVCLNKLQISSVFSVDESKALCKCVTRDAFYFIPGLIMSYAQGTDSFFKTDVMRDVDKIKTFDDFEKLSIESDTISNSDPFFKKQEIVYSTAMGGCLRGFVQGYLLDTEAVADELFERNK